MLYVNKHFGIIKLDVLDFIFIVKKTNCVVPLWQFQLASTHSLESLVLHQPVTLTLNCIIARTWKQPRCPSADEWIRKLWYIYTMEYHSAIKKNSFESVLMRWMKLEPIIHSEVSQKDKDQYSILMHIYGIQKDDNDNPICKTEKETQMYRTEFWTLQEKVRVGRFERTASKHVYYQM